MACASSESPPRPRHSNSSLDTEFVPLCVYWPHWTVTEVLKEVRAAPGGGGAGSYMVVQTVKNQPAMQETKVWSLGQEDPLEKEMATHASILIWEIPWIEEPGELQSMGLHRVRHDWTTNIFTFNPHKSSLGGVFNDFRKCKGSWDQKVWELLLG